MKLKTLALTAALAVMGATAASAQSQCAPHEDVVARLAEKYGETLQNAGFAMGGQATMETYASAETGSWTIVMVSEGQLQTGESILMACLIASGQGFESVPQPAAE